MNEILGMLLKSKLQQMGLPTDGVNFSDVNSINDFAKQILPKMMQANPMLKNFIKQNMGVLDNKTKEQVTEVIDSI